ncbi:hypothetical protein, partial [Escherichia coli]|uniref:hypothetical protein n=1 Tax=Escherichia coli TaxID=562 RepID=UPI001E3852D2
MPRPYRFPVKFLSGIYREISASFLSLHRSPQPNDRAERVSERGSGISLAVYLLLTHTNLIFHLLYVAAMP